MQAQFLQYKGGVPKDEKWLAVAETKYARVLRYWCETMNSIYTNTRGFTL